MNTTRTVLLLSTFLIVVACGTEVTSDGDSDTAGLASAGTTITTTTDLTPATAAPPVATTTRPAAATTTKSPSATTPDPNPTITFENGTVIGGGHLSFQLGVPARITVRSDFADEAHLHGYDISLSLEPGVPATLEFPADIPGVFELELENTGELLAEIEVSP